MSYEQIEALYLAEYPRLFCYAKALLSDSSEAEDVVQNTFEFAVRHLDILQNHPNPQAWLIKVLKYKVLEHIRNKPKEVLYPDADALYKYTFRPKPHYDLLSEKYHLKVLRSKLADEEYELLKMVSVYGLSYNEAAEILDLSPAACRKRLERTRKKVKKYL